MALPLSGTNKKQGGANTPQATLTQMGQLGVNANAPQPSQSKTAPSQSYRGKHLDDRQSDGSVDPSYGGAPMPTPQATMASAPAALPVTLEPPEPEVSTQNLDPDGSQTPGSIIQDSGGNIVDGIDIATQNLYFDQFKGLGRTYYNGEEYLYDAGSDRWFSMGASGDPYLSFINPDTGETDYTGLSWTDYDLLVSNGGGEFGGQTWEWDADAQFGKGAFVVTGTSNVDTNDPATLWGQGLTFFGEDGSIVDGMSLGSVTINNLYAAIQNGETPSFWQGGKKWTYDPETQSFRDMGTAHVADNQIVDGPLPDPEPEPTGDPNAVAGNQLYGVDSLFGRVGMRKVWGPGKNAVIRPPTSQALAPPDVTEPTDPGGTGGDNTGGDGNNGDGNGNTNTGNTDTGNTGTAPPTQYERGQNVNGQYFWGYDADGNPIFMSDQEFQFASNTENGTWERGHVDPRDPNMIFWGGPNNDEWITKDEYNSRVNAEALPKPGMPVPDPNAELGTANWLAWVDKHIAQANESLSDRFDEATLQDAWATQQAINARISSVERLYNGWRDYLGKAQINGLRAKLEGMRNEWSREFEQRFKRPLGSAKDPKAPPPTDDPVGLPPKEFEGTIQDWNMANTELGKPLYGFGDMFDTTKPASTNARALVDAQRGLIEWIESFNWPPAMEEDLMQRAYDQFTLWTGEFQSQYGAPFATFLGPPTSGPGGGL